MRVSGKSAGTTRFKTAEERDAVEDRRERAEAEDDAIEDDVERRQQRADRRAARRTRSSAPRTSSTSSRTAGERRASPGRGSSARRSSRRSEGGPSASATWSVRLLVARAEQAEEEHNEEPRRADRDGEPTRVIEALLREGDDGDAEAERVGRMQPPELPSVLAHERADAFARRRRERHGVDDADLVTDCGRTRRLARSPLLCQADTREIIVLAPRVADLCAPILRRCGPMIDLASLGAVAFPPRALALEELGVAVRLKQYKRDPKTILAPPELKKVHPLGKSPVITDGDRTVAESGVILDYLAAKYGQGKWRPAEGTPERARYDYWLHYAEGSAMTPLVLKLVSRWSNADAVARATDHLRDRREGAAGVHRSADEAPLRLGRSELAKRPWFAGDELDGCRHPDELSGRSQSDAWRRSASPALAGVARQDPRAAGLSKSRRTGRSGATG